MTVELSPQLETARKWALALGNEVEITTITDMANTKRPAIGIKHGSIGLLAAEINGTLSVAALLGVPPDFRTASSMLPADLRFQMLESVRQALMDCPRVGWTLLPQTTASIEQLEALQMLELMRLADGDVQSFNRFADAIQELVTMVVRVQSVFGALLAGGPRSTGPSSAAREIYR
ncbi:MAG: hypothetical protein L3K01_02565 [Thermoplasmata archaeon]|nr:hypothetical protein [Thermoplasmata archaeon]